MAKVYLLTQGEYSEYHIVGVYSTREKAEAHKPNHRNYFGTDPDIEEHELDPPCSILPDTWKVIMDRDGNSLEEPHLTEGQDKESFNLWDSKKDNEYAFWVHAKDKAHAVKVANEMRIRKIIQGDTDGEA